jgi:hypothetical protein
MLEIVAVEPLHDRVVRLTLSDGSVVVRDLGDLLDGRGVFARITTDDVAFHKVYADYGTIVWPGDVDLAAETLIWDGPMPADEATRKPEPILRHAVRRPPAAARSCCLRRVRGPGRDRWSSCARRGIATACTGACHGVGGDPTT